MTNIIRLFLGGQLDKMASGLQLELLSRYRKSISGGFAPSAFLRFFSDYLRQIVSHRIRVTVGLFITKPKTNTVKKLSKLKDAGSLFDLALLLGYQPKKLSFIIYKISDDEKYSTFELPKKSGGTRKIKAPDIRLKSLQRRLADLLQDCYDELYNYQSQKKSLSHGFRRNHSIISNATKHKNKRYVFNIDLIDFFPSLNFGRVRGFFIKSNDFSLDPKVATIIAQIACHYNELPQGSPCSPVISNLIGHILDIKLVRLAQKAKCSFSRYADDITFSTREKEFPTLIAFDDPDKGWLPSKNLETLIQKSGFRINTNKVSMQHWTNTQLTTGLVVNKKVNTKASYYRQARAMCDSLFRKGEFYICKVTDKGNSAGHLEPILGTKNQLRGILGFIYSVKKRHDVRDITEKWKNPTAIHELYRKFLYFDRFHSNIKPTIICEGKTDNVYLKCAVKSLSDQFPNLITVTSDYTEYHIDFFKYSNINMDLMQFSGGTGDISSFMHHYNKRTRHCLCDGKFHPVIILIDNDSGSKPIINKAKKLFKISFNEHNDFYHLTKNLYLVIIPLIKNNVESMIEDFFDDETRGTILDGKKFNPKEKDFDRNNEYGKHVFAEKVIKKNQSNIDFTNFKPILLRIETVIDDYKIK